MRQVTIAHLHKTFPTTFAAPGLLLLSLALSGCGPAGAGAPDLKPPHVLVSKPVRDTVTDYEDFTGETRAVKSIDVRARVTGYLEKVRFTEGTEVKEGEKLLRDRPPYLQGRLRPGPGQRGAWPKPTWSGSPPTSSGPRNCCP